MSKLSDKIRIVSSDGRVVEEAGKGISEGTGKSEVVEKESIVDKVKGMFGKKKVVEEEPEEDLSNVIGRPEVEEPAESVVDRVKNMISKDKDEGYSDEPVDLGHSLGRGANPRGEMSPKKKSSKRKSTGGQSTGGQSGQLGGSSFGELEDVSEEKKKNETPMLIGIILALAVVGIAIFIYFFNSSAMAAVDVEPQQIEDQAVEQVLEGDPENFIDLVEGGQDVEVVEASDDTEVEEEPVDKEIIVDTPQEKERLEDHVEQLESTIEELVLENKELESRLSEAIEKLASPQPDEAVENGEGGGK